jgi:hypothetical protein
MSREKRNTGMVKEEVGKEQRHDVPIEEDEAQAA